jgi:hypothetical protein
MFRCYQYLQGASLGPNMLVVRVVSLARVETFFASLASGLPLFQSVENSKHFTSVRSIDVHGVTDVSSLALLGKLSRTEAVSYMKLHVTLSQSYFVSARAFYGRNHNNNHLQDTSADHSKMQKSVAISLQRSMHSCERDPRAGCNSSSRHSGTMHQPHRT